MPLFSSPQSFMILSHLLTEISNFKCASKKCGRIIPFMHSPPGGDTPTCDISLDSAHQAEKIDTSLDLLPQCFNPSPPLPITSIPVTHPIHLLYVSNAPWVVAPVTGLTCVTGMKVIGKGEGG